MEALVVGAPRTVTALAPVLVLHVDEINLTSLRVTLADLGLDRRLGWLIENTANAVREELLQPLPSAWSRRYRRALVVLESTLASSSLQQSAEAFDPKLNPPDILDGHIRSKATLDKVWGAASPTSRRWGIATSLQKQDFVEALRGARASD